MEERDLEHLKIHRPMMDAAQPSIWVAPTQGTIRIDVDASLYQQSSAACARNSTGDWLKGFMSNLGNLPITISEVYSIKNGLRLCSSLNIEKAVIYSDSLEAINLIYRGVNTGHPFVEAIYEIQEAICSHDNYRILYTPRDNLCRFLSQNGS